MSFHFNFIPFVFNKTLFNIFLLICVISELDRSN